MTKSASSFLPLAADSNRNKSIISYDISESEASKSTTIDSLLPKKIVPKLELSSPIGPEPIKDFNPSTEIKKKDKKKDKVAEKKIDKDQNQKTQLVKTETPYSAITISQKDSIPPDSILPIPASLIQKPLVSKKIISNKQYVPGLFKGSSLLTHQITPKVLSRQTNDWSTSVLLLVVGIACIINVSYRSRLKQLFNAFARNRFVGQIVREENVMLQRINIFLSITFLLVGALFIFQLGNFFNLPFASNSSMANYSVIVISLLVFYFIKISAFNFLGFLFKIEKEMREYVFTLLLYNHFIGVGLIPVVVLVAFLPGFANKYLFFAIGTIVAIAFLLRTLRSYGNVSGGSRFSIFYLFLYLCTLEILPLVIIAKLIINIV